MQTKVRSAGGWKRTTSGKTEEFRHSISWRLGILSRPIRGIPTGYSDVFPGEMIRFQRTGKEKNVYETTESPKDTKEITALRLDPDSAVMDCTIAGLEEAHPDVHLSSGTGTAGSYRPAMPPDGTYFLAWINQALAILTRTAMAGADLRNHRVDTALLECLIADAHAQIFLARDLLYAGDCGASVTELSLALGTMIALRDTCWSFLSSGTLPIDSIPGIRSSVVSLDRACSMIVFD